MVTIDRLRYEELDEFNHFYDMAFGGTSEKSVMSSQFLKISKDPNYHLVTAKVNGRICGYTMAVLMQDFVGDGKPFMTLWSVCVHPKYRNRGTGSKLLNHIQTLAKQLDCEFITFITGAHRTGAHEFYRRTGYDLSRELAGIKFL